MLVLVQFYAGDKMKKKLCGTILVIFGFYLLFCILMSIFSPTIPILPAADYDESSMREQKFIAEVFLLKKQETYYLLEQKLMA